MRKFFLRFRRNEISNRKWCRSANRWDLVLLEKRIFLTSLISATIKANRSRTCHSNFPMCQKEKTFHSAPRSIFLFISNCRWTWKEIYLKYRFEIRRRLSVTRGTKARLNPFLDWARPKGKIRLVFVSSWRRSSKSRKRSNDLVFIVISQGRTSLHERTSSLSLVLVFIQICFIKLASMWFNHQFGFLKGVRLLIDQKIELNHRTEMNSKWKD